MVACAFGILCNKLRIFHCAIDVYADFCDVIVKTSCILHNFVRETAFSFRMLYTNVPSRVLRLLAPEVMLQEHICGGGLRVRAPPSVEAPLGSLAGSLSTGDIRVEEDSGDRHLSP
jgi:hypothetical protein